jgi:hypothetical protein
MIVANFYHLKNTNGLFYYGIDYLHENIASVKKILVRPALHAAAARAFPDSEIVACTLARYCTEILAARRRADFIYTPTSHPLPFLSRQMVVVHDVYPFLGLAGSIKALLLRMSLATSNCKIGYINNSDARSFALRIGAQQGRTLFAPNKFPQRPAGAIERKARDGAFTVGLFGTDSSKKNYAGLFQSWLAHPERPPLRFAAYGHRTPYFEDLLKDHPQVEVELVESDTCSLAQFLARVDLVVSVADHEGFGRPIATALLGGVPCLLAQRPVFAEFFSGGAHLVPDIPAVVDAMIAHARGVRPPAQAAYAPPPAAVDGYRSAVSYLRSQAAYNN